MPSQWVANMVCAACVFAKGPLAFAVQASDFVGGEKSLVFTHSARVAAPVKSWKTLRDDNIVKQNLDFSCGAASLATLLYVKNRKQDHFTVLRGISGDTVWLADPSLGNRTFSREQFLSMWQTWDGDDGLAGKFLAVLPVDANATVSKDFFSRTPARQSAMAVQGLAPATWRP